MGVFDFLFGRHRETPTQRATTPPRQPRLQTPAYAVIDVETTGLSSKTERILELARRPSGIFI
ncbi:hypothetical protein [Frondihabitans sp. VKM Ac-2883]|uniref:hypothetical protein n=1 Tax=Frondihabitans sp. VKM Ac-2883 TaxID=2783823 RepID=UPI00188D5230|nr:hypothetical protein [Frondihabitans sp. VKM Ac-2883]MBF4575187.1 hypothetical protein [Frondihabitans sp. VKM Ac-2883]